MKRRLPQIPSLYTTLLLLCLLIPLHVKALPNKLQFVNYSQNNSDLTFDGIRTVVEDVHGYIWVGTYKGLNRFDGNRFRSYGSDELGVATDYITALGEDAEGNLWVGTDVGIVVYRYASDRFESLHSFATVEAEPNERVYTIARDAAGTMWIGARSGLYCYDSKLHRIHRVSLCNSDGRSFSSIYRIAVSPTALYLASYCNTILRFDPVTETLVEVDPRYAGDDIEGLVVTPDATNGHDVLYVAGKRTGLTCATDGRTLLTIASDHRPTQLTLGPDSLLYLASTGGLICYDLANGTHRIAQKTADDRFSLTDSYVTDVLVDSRSSLWVGTQSGGLCRADSRLDLFHKIYRTADGASLVASGVSALAEDATGTLWIATSRRGLLRLDAGATAPTSYKHERIPLAITALCTDGDRLWIGAQQGVVCLNRITGEVRTYRDLEGDNRIISFARLHHSDDELWAATATGVARYNEATDRFQSIAPLSRLTVEDMQEDGEGRVWLATYAEGIYSYDPQTSDLKQYCTHAGNCLVPDMISSLCLDPHGRLWVASFGQGLFAYDRVADTFVTPDRLLSNLANSVLLSIEADSQENLWISTTHGLVRLNTASGIAQSFTEADGLLDTIFRKAALRRADGTLLFGSDDGLIAFNPSALTTLAPARSMLIADLRIGGHGKASGSRGNADVLSQLTLSPGENSFVVTFAAPGEVAVHSYERLLCRLEGYSEAWRDVTETMCADFFGIRPGTYRLQLRTLGADGAMVEARPDLIVVAEPRFFESTLGMLLLFFASTFLATLIAVWCYRRAVRREKQRHADAARRHEMELFDDKIRFLKGVMNELKTPLTLIRMPLGNLLQRSDMETTITDELRVASGGVDRLSHLMDELEEFVEAESKDCVLLPRNFDLTERLGLLCAEYDSELPSPLHVTFEANPTTVCVCVDDRLLDRLFDCLIRGARCFARQHISVAIRRDESGMAVVTVGFDGTPQHDEASLFKPFVQADGQSSVGIGLPLAKRLAEMLGGNLRLAQDGGAFVLRLPTIANLPEAEQAAVVLVERADATQRTVLLVEPSAELAAYMRRKLESEYRVVLATTGEQALVELHQREVDLMLADASLSDKSASELCRQATTDFETSHIPVVIIGAATASNLKRACMSAGASLYIEKPFDLEYVIACVSGIIDRRVQWRRAIESASQEATTDVSTSPVDLLPALPNLDEEFLRRMDGIIAERLSDPDFSSKQLADELCLSYSSLNRKVKALLEMTPNDYLRKKRLAAAACMLRADGYRIGEIGRLAGFASSSYFAKCFKEEYGMLPGEVRRTAVGGVDSEET